MNETRLLSFLQKSNGILNRRDIKSSRFYPNDLQAVRGMVSHSTPSSMAAIVIATLSFHADCIRHKIDDGRKYWKYCRGSNCVALTGLHNRIWDPPNVCWGGWFCAKPTLPSTVKLAVLADLIKTCIDSPQKQNLLIEVYGDESDSNIYQIYKKLNFPEEGRLHNFYGPQKDLVIMSVDLDTIRAKWSTI